LAQVTAARLRETPGRPTHFITQLQDINARKIMEEELISRQRFNQMIMDNLPIGIAVSSGEFPLRSEYMNDNFAEFFGTTREALAGTDVFFDAVFEDPEFRRAMRRRILTDIRSGAPKRMRWENMPIARKGVQTRYVTAYNAQVPGRDMWITIVTDETERVRALEVLEKNAARFRKLREFDQAVIKGFESFEKIGETTLAYIFELIDSDKAGIAIFHAGDRRVEVMTARQKGPEYEYRTHVLDEGEAELYQMQGRPAVYDAAEIADDRLAASIRRIFDIGGEMRGTHGLIRPLHSSQRPVGILYVERHDGGFSMPDRDMLLEIGLLSALAVEQKRLQLLSEHYANDLEEMILERTAQLEEAVKELEAFTYTVSHDLRAPLRSMNGFVRILMEDYGARLDDEGRRVCGIIAGSARQMGRLIDDLLALSRIGRSEMVILPVNMAPLVKNLYIELTTEEQRAEIGFSVGGFLKSRRTRR
jgi:signal transduction histidine kinase